MTSISAEENTAWVFNLLPKVWRDTRGPARRRGAPMSTATISNIIADWFRDPSSASRPASEPGSSSGDAAEQAASRTRTQPRLPVRQQAWPSAGVSSLPQLLHRGGCPAESRMLSPALRQQLGAAIPSRFALSDWRLLYSTHVHGISLNTFYLRTQGCGACILAIKDTSGHVFGAFCTEWRPPSLPANFYGGGESFVFQVERLKDLPPLPLADGPPPDQACQVFRWTGTNNYFMFSAKDHLAVGSGGHFALWLDAELLHGSSGGSMTFDNPPLCCDPAAASAGPEERDEVLEFQCNVLEVWGVDSAAIARRDEAHRREGVEL